MNKFLTIFEFQIIEAIVNYLVRHGTPPTTVDILRALTGKYLVDKDTPVSQSNNAAFGKLLGKLRDSGIIRQAGAKIRVRDDRGRATTSASWLPN